MNKLIFFSIIFVLATSIFFPVVAEDVADIKSITGTVVDKDGPIADQTVILKAHNMGNFLEVSRTQTDGNGKYKFDDLAPDAVFFIDLEYNGIKHTKATKIGGVGDVDNIVADFNLLGELKGVIRKEDGASVSDIPVTLSGQFGEILINTLTDEGGNYSFSPLNTDEMYTVAFTYEDTLYSDSITIKSETITILDFTIHGTTKDDKDIHLSSHHIVITPKKDWLLVTEFLNFRNDGDKIFKNGMLKIGFPGDLYDFVPSNEGDIQKFEDYILFEPKDPIIPGQEYGMSVEYKVNSTSKEHLFERVTSYTTDSFAFFIEDLGGIKAEPIEGVGGPKSEIINNMRYLILDGAGIGPNSSVSIKLSEIPTPMGGSYMLFWLVPLIAVVTFIFIHPLIKGGVAKKNKLFSKIEKVENKYKAGDISKNEYEIIRSKYKERIIGLMEEIDNLKDKKRR